MDSPMGSALPKNSSYMPHEWPENEFFDQIADQLIAAAQRIHSRNLSWEVLKNSSVSKKNSPRDRAIRDAQSYEISTESTIVSSNDGVHLAIYIKDALSICFEEDSSRDLRSYFEQAVEELIKIYEPPRAARHDPRHRTKNANGDDIPLGLFHLAYWKMSGHAHGPPELSSDLRPRSQKKQEAMNTFMKHYAPVAQAVGMWFKKLDPETYERYHSFYNQMAEKGNLGSLHQCRRGTYIGLALLINKIVNPHTDSNDVRWGWVNSLCWGQFEGANPVYPDLRRIFVQKPLDLLMTRAPVLEHWNTDLIAGQRYCTVFFSKANVMDPKAAPHVCEYCPSAYATAHDLQRHCQLIVRAAKAGKDIGQHDIGVFRERYQWDASGYQQKSVLPAKKINRRRTTVRFKKIVRQ